MANKLWILAVFLLSTAVAAAAQDAKTVLQAASAAMGADKLRSIRYTGTGYNAAVGQSFGTNDDWPKFEISSYTRTIDYDAKYSREELTRKQGSYPPQGGGGTPISGEQRQVSLVNGNYAWNVQGTNAVPQPAGAEVRLLDLWLSPHGFLKAALAANPTAVSMNVNGNRVTIVSFTALGKYRVNGSINAQNLVEGVQTWVANPVLGDMVYEHRYSEYKDFAGVKFPTILHSHQGDYRVNQGRNWMEIRVTDVQPNVNAGSVAIPDNVRQATVQPVRVQSQSLANGIWRIAGGSHHSIAVEFRNFVAVVEAPLDEERSLAVIAEIERLAPEKPIQFVVNTHHHFDHSGGLRTYVAHGATVVTHQANRNFYEQAVFFPSARTIQPDRLSSAYPYFSGDRILAMEPVNQKYVISDGSRTMDIHPVQGLNHSSNMLVVYLPAERILINADLYSPPPAGTPAPQPNASMRSLLQNIQRLNLDVAQHVPIHGEPGPHDQFLKIVGTGSN